VSAVFHYVLSLTLSQALLRMPFVFLLAACVIGLVRFRRLPLNLRWLAGLLAFVAPMNAAGLVLMLQHRNNLFLMPLYAVGELGGLALVYRHTLHSPAFSKFVPWLVVGFAAYVLLDLWLAPGLLQFRPGQQVVHSLVVVGMVTLYARHLLRAPRAYPLRQEPMVWVSVGLFVYCMGYVQIALFSAYLLRYSQQLNLNIWAINSVLIAGLYGCYARALWMPPAS
jgi:hypothetical protein